MSAEPPPYRPRRFIDSQRARWPAALAVLMALSGTAWAGEMGGGPAAMAHIACLEALLAKSLASAVPLGDFEHSLRFACPDERYRAFAEIRSEIRREYPSVSAEKVNDVADGAIRMDDQAILYRYRAVLAKLPRN